MTSRSPVPGSWWGQMGCMSPRGMHRLSKVSEREGSRRQNVRAHTLQHEPEDWAQQSKHGFQRWRRAMAWDQAGKQGWSAAFGSEHVPGCGSKNLKGNIIMVVYRSSLSRSTYRCWQRVFYKDVENINCESKGEDGCHHQIPTKGLGKISPSTKVN